MQVGEQMLARNQDLELFLQNMFGVHFIIPSLNRNIVSKFDEICLLLSVGIKISARASIPSPVCVHLGCDKICYNRNQYLVTLC
jgi:hypothetical protein